MFLVIFPNIRYYTVISPGTNLPELADPQTGMLTEEEAEGQGTVQASCSIWENIALYSQAERHDRPGLTQIKWEKMDIVQRNVDIFCFIFIFIFINKI